MMKLRILKQYMVIFDKACQNLFLYKEGELVKVAGKSKIRKLEVFTHSDDAYVKEALKKLLKAEMSFLVNSFSYDFQFQNEVDEFESTLMISRLDIVMSLIKFDKELSKEWMS